MRVNVYLFLGQCIILYSKCGFISAKALIGQNVGQVQAGEFAYIVSIMKINFQNPQSGGNHFCTGVLTTRKDILTAAHCLQQEELNYVQVIVGTINLRNGTKFYPFWWTSYDDWATANNITIDFALNDIANIRLLELVSRNLFPTRLSSLSNHELYGAEVTVAGWGVSNNGLTPDIMETATVRVLTRAECERQVERIAGERLSVDLRIVCTKANPYILLNDGDSGGPLLFRNRLIAINKGLCSISNHSRPTTDVNIHIGIHYYRYFIRYMKNIV